MIVDAVFQGRDKHSNHGDTVQKMIQHMVNKIRKQYRTGVPIIIRMDSGFFDQKIFEIIDINYICGGKLYKDITAMADQIEGQMWEKYSSGKKDFWEYLDFGSRRGNWKRFRRAVYCRLTNDGNQLYLPGFRLDTVIITTRPIY